MKRESHLSRNATLPIVYELVERRTIHIAYARISYTRQTAGQVPAGRLCMYFQDQIEPVHKSAVVVIVIHETGRTAGVATDRHDPLLTIETGHVI